MDAVVKRDPNEEGAECPICWEMTPFLLTFKCSHTLCMRCYAHIHGKCPFCHQQVIPRLPSLEEFRAIVEREDPRVIPLLGLDYDIRHIFISRLITMVSASLPLRQLLYIRSICAMSGPSGTRGFTIAHDLNDIPSSNGTSLIQFGRCINYLRGTDSPLFQEIHAEAIGRLTSVCQRASY